MEADEQSHVVNASRIIAGILTWNSGLLGLPVGLIAKMAGWAILINLASVFVPFFTHEWNCLFLLCIQPLKLQDLIPFKPYGECKKNVRDKNDFFER